MRALALAIPFLLLSGCTSPPATPGGDVLLQYDDGHANKVDVPVLPSTPPGPGERSLEAAPQWRLGEWWDYTVTDHFSGNSIQVKRIVAGTFGSQYLVGFPLDAFSNDALVLHLPGYGDVDMDDLSFEVHDVDQKLLDFPLTAGKSWDSHFEGRAGNVTVLSTTATTAELQFTDSRNGSFDWSATYDADTGEVVRMHDPSYATVEVTGHGYGYEGAVRVPHAHDLVFQNGRFGAWGLTQGPAQDPAPAALRETVEVQAGYDRLAFVVVVGGGAQFVGGPATGGLGAYKETVTSPNGTVYEVATGPLDEGLRIVFFGTGDPTGTWTLDHQAAGPGIVLTEGIGYHSIDIALPSGCVLPGPNAGHHVNPCTGTMSA